MTKLRIAGYVDPSSPIGPTAVGMLTLHMAPELAQNPGEHFALRAAAEKVRRRGMPPAEYVLNEQGNSCR